MKEFDLIQASKEIQKFLGTHYFVTFNYNYKKGLEIKGAMGMFDMASIDYVYKFCVQHNLKYYIDTTRDNCPTFVIFK